MMAAAPTPAYAEPLRPQFHFTAETGWLNDPNGLVFYRGEYHLFFQHNPSGTDWGNMTWGHAVSRDLVHWKQLEEAIRPDARGTIFSGSAVVDWPNSSGLGNGKEPPLVATYTAAGGTSPESKGEPFTQCLAYSLDAGRTWEKYGGNPVLGHIAGENRDPKVTWYAPGRRWIMVLYLEGSDFAFFSSPDPKAWTLLQRMTVPSCDECPDFFEIPVEGRPRERRWVWTAANGKYLVGSFDGKTFRPEGPLQTVEYGPNCYAVQTYSDIPARDGRRVQIGWMRGGQYPGMPFNQQMTFPCALRLYEGADGLHLRKWPVKEIRTLYEPARRWKAAWVRPGADLLRELPGDLFDVAAAIRPGAAGEVGFRVHGTPVLYSARDSQLRVGSASAFVPLQKGVLHLRLLVDRTSVEVFSGRGEVCFSCCFLPEAEAPGLDLFCSGSPCRVENLMVTPLRSAWDPRKEGREPASNGT